MEYCASTGLCRPDSDCTACSLLTAVDQVQHQCVTASAVTCHADGSQEYCPGDQKCKPDGDCSTCGGYTAVDTSQHLCVEEPSGSVCHGRGGQEYCSTLHLCLPDNDCTTCPGSGGGQGLFAVDQSTHTCVVASGAACHADNEKEYCGVDFMCRPAGDCSGVLSGGLCPGYTWVTTTLHECINPSTTSCGNDGMMFCQPATGSATCVATGSCASTCTGKIAVDNVNNQCVVPGPLTCLLGGKYWCSETSTCEDNCDGCTNLWAANPANGLCRAASPDNCWEDNSRYFCGVTQRCGSDCSACTDGIRVNTFWNPTPRICENAAGCSRSCAGKECGDDGCGNGCDTSTYQPASCPSYPAAVCSAASTCVTNYCHSENINCGEHGTCLSEFQTGFVAPTLTPEQIALLGSTASDKTYCLCDAGWTGEHCQTVVTCPSNCNGHGVCTATNICDCDDAWAGFECDRTTLTYISVVPYIGQHNVVRQPSGNVPFTVQFNRDIQLASHDFSVSVTEKTSGGSTGSFTIGKNDLTASADTLSFQVPTTFGAQYSIAIPDGAVEDVGATTSFETTRNPIANTFVFTVSGDGASNVDFPDTATVLVYAVRVVPGERDPDPCREYDADSFKTEFETEVRGSTSINIDLICTQCDAAWPGCATQSLMDAVTAHKRGKAAIQEEKSIAVAFQFSPVAADGVPGFAWTIIDKVESASYEILKDATLYTYATTSVTAAELVAMDVTNYPSVAGGMSAVSFTLESSTSVALSMMQDGYVKLTAPDGWVLDADPVNWDVTVRTPQATEQYHSGEFAISGQTVTIDMSHNGFDGGHAVPGENVWIDVDRGLQMPPSCNDMNGWQWAVQFFAADNTLTQYRLMNPASDTCDNKKVFVFGDPHFISFSGGEYDITGKAGYIYNIITDTHFNWNAEFVSRNARSSMFTYIGKSGFLINGTRVLCDPVRKIVTVDGEDVPASKYDQRLYLTPESPYYVKVSEKVVFLRVPGFRIALKYMAQDHGKPLAHFDHFIDLADDALGRTNPHGLLGQTATFTSPVKPQGKNGQGVIAGVVNDYEVHSLFTLKFKFGRYEAA